MVGQPTTVYDLVKTVKRRPWYYRRVYGHFGYFVYDLARGKFSGEKNRRHENRTDEMVHCTRVEPEALCTGVGTVIGISDPHNNTGVFFFFLCYTFVDLYSFS